MQLFFIIQQKKSLRCYYIFFLLWWQHNEIFIVYFLSFLILQRTKSCNETSVMSMWCVNKNVRSVNEKRMPTLKRKHDDLRWTASAPGQKKLVFKPPSKKTAETKASFNSFHCFRLLKWGAFHKIFRILGLCGTFIWEND